MLICVSGRGWYQEWDGEPRELYPGDVVNIPAGVKHWHGSKGFLVPTFGYRSPR